MLLLGLQSKLAKCLSEDRAASAYLQARGISGFTVDDLGIGYCNFSTFEVAGVDLSGRITFPIHDIHGDMVGFGGRSIGDRHPKYLNSPASPVYDKSRIVYNLHQAQDYILEAGFALVVEGYFDVATLWQCGVRNTVSTCGTSLTKWHVRMLKRFADRVVLLFDDDRAGDTGATRAAALAAAEKFPLLVSGVPFGMDPDEWARMYGKEGILELVKNAKETEIN
jgi:DNA primase